MMDVQLLAVLFIAIFIVHELEEIIYVRPWVERNKKNPKLKKQLWIQKFSSGAVQPAMFRAMVGEEFAIVIMLTFAATYFSLYAMYAGLLLAYSTHLVAHIADAIRRWRYIPGAATAAATLPLSGWMVWSIGLRQNVPAAQIVAWGVFFGVGIAANLLFLYWLANVVSRGKDGV